MRYFYNPPTSYTMTSAGVYECDHPLYTHCTLYLFEPRGLAVIQQRFNTSQRLFWWGPIDPWLVDDIFNQDNFMTTFDKYAGVSTDGLYPTITVRKLMWELRMKPIRKQYWEYAP